MPKVPWVPKVPRVWCQGARGNPRRQSVGNVAVGWLMKRRDWDFVVNAAFIAAFQRALRLGSGGRPVA